MLNFDIVRINKFKYFLQLLAPILLVLLLTSCGGGSRCIEADDFGEYTTAEIFVPAKSTACEWNPDNPAGSSPTLLNCMVGGGPGSQSYDLATIPGLENVASGTLTINKNCNEIAINDLSGCQIRTVDETTGDESWPVGTNEECGNFTPLVRNECERRCVESCKTTTGEDYEPKWISLELSKTNPNLVISPNVPILIDATGTITIAGANISNFTFVRVDRPDIIDGFSAGPETREISVTGRWCDGISGSNSRGNWDVCQANQQVGIVTTSEGQQNVSAETLFLKRLAMFSIPYPTNPGIPETFNFNSWTCDYGNNDDDNFSDTCKINYLIPFEFYNEGEKMVVEGSLDELYNPAQTVLGQIGGLVNKNANSMGQDPFEDYECSIDGAGDYTCQSTTTQVNETRGKIIGTSQSFFSFNNESGIVKFKILPENNTIGSAGTGECKIRITTNGENPRELTISADSQTWTYLQENGTNLLFGPSDNLTIEILGSTEGGFDNWNNGVNDINCGQGLALAKEPTTDIVFEKSGFISFKILGSETNVGGTCSITARIINPANETTAEDYYEYSDTEQPINNLVVTADGTWHGKIFVRKGQLLRFNPSTWNGSWSYLGQPKKCGVGLAMKIEERPALLCKGTASEEIRNPNCIPVFSSSGVQSCATSRELICTKESNYCSETGFTSCESNPNNCTIECERCVAAVADASSIEPTTEATTMQCYDLENYTGKVADINPNNAGLTQENTTKGAVILRPYNYERGYGNMSGASCFYETILETETSSGTPQIISDDENSSCVFRNMNIRSNSRMKFFVLEEASFLDLGSQEPAPYTNNSSGGSEFNNYNGYNISSSVQKSFRNGRYLEASLCQKDVAGNNVCYNVDNIANELEPILKIDQNSITSINGGYTYSSAYSVNELGRVVNLQDQLGFYVHNKIPGVPAGAPLGSNITISFKIHDPEKNLYSGGVKNICQGEDCKSLSVYYDNDGGYNVRVRVGRTDTRLLSITKKIIEPVIDIIDGKSVRISARLCDSDYIVNSPYLQCFRASTGESCGFTDVTSGSMTDPDCFIKCDPAIDNNCQYATETVGLIEHIYKILIQNPYYKTILNLALVLFVTFYGFGFFIGLTTFTQTELIMRLFKVGFVYLLVSENGWTFFREYFVTFFKAGVDYLTFTMAAAFDIDGTLKLATDFTDKSILFKGADDVVTLFFSSEVQAKVWGLFFASWFGWAYVALIFFSMLIFIVAMANALIIYLTAQIFISLLLSLAPIFIILILFGMTKSMFDKWLSAIISFALQQIFLVTTLTFFSILMKEMLKFVLSYRVCWEPIWTIPLGITNIEIFKFWKIAGLAEGASPNAMGNIAPSITHILFIFLIASTLKKFLGFMVNLATNLGGGISAVNLTSGITGAVEKLSNKATGLVSGRLVKPVLGRATRAVLGTTTLEERTKARETEKQKKKRDVVMSNNIRNSMLKVGSEEIGNSILESGVNLEELKEHIENKKGPMERKDQEKIMTKLHENMVSKEIERQGLGEDEKNRFLSDKSILGDEDFKTNLKSILDKEDFRTNLKDKIETKLKAPPAVERQGAPVAPAEQGTLGASGIPKEYMVKEKPEEEEEKYPLKKEETAEE